MERVFRLQGLLNLRQLQEEQAAGRLAVANADLHEADQQLNEARERLSSMNTSGSTNLAVAAAMRNAARMQIAEGIARKEYAQAVVERRQDEWSGAKRQAATLEKLENRHIEEVTADDLHKEQVVLDELAIQRGSGKDMDGSRTKNRDRSVTEKGGK